MIKIKKIASILLIIFIIFFVFCVVYSVTFYQYNLPKVEAVMPESGSFNYNYRIESVVEADTKKEYDFLVKFVVEFDLELDFFYLFNGDMVDVVKPSERDLEVTAKIINIKKTDDKNIEVLAGFNSKKIHEKDDVIVTIDKTSSFMETILPSTAVFYDAFFSQYYYYEIVKEDGPFSKNYIVKKREIDVLAKKGDLIGSFDKNSGIPIMSKTESILEDGDSVRFYS